MIWIGDLEANGLRGEATKVHCGVFQTLDGKQTRKFYPGSHPSHIEAMLEFLDTVPTLCMHNGIGYDWPLLEELYGYQYKGEKLDTMVMSRLQKPKRPIPYNCPNKKAPHSVEVWGYRVGRGKPDHQDWMNYSPEMLHRCTEDVEIQRLIYLELEKEREGYHWTPALKLTHKLFEILERQKTYGWMVDQDHMHKSIRILTHWMDRIDKALAPKLPLVLEVEEQKVKGEFKYVKEPFLKSGLYNHHVLKWMDKVGMNPEERIVCGPHSRVNFRPLDPNSRVEAIDYLLSVGWIPKEWNTNDEGERTSPKLSKDDPFDGVEGKVGNLFAKRVVCKHRRSVIEGLFKHIRPDGRIPSEVANLAETGRATHRKIVNIPNCESFFGRWMRKIFIAARGKVLVSADAAGCQDRATASLCNDDDYTNMLLNGDKSKGTDGHSLAMKAVNIVAREYNLAEITRGKAKNFNFANKFGAAFSKLGGMLGAEKTVGERVKQELDLVFPAQAKAVDQLYIEWKSHAKKRLKTIHGKRGSFQVVDYYDGWVEGLDGRPIFVKSPHALLVYYVQSAEAIMMWRAYCMAYHLLNKKYEWGRQWGFVCHYHDEMTVECDPDIAEDVARILEYSIGEAGRFFKQSVAQVGEAEIGMNWAEVH